MVKKARCRCRVNSMKIEGAVLHIEMGRIWSVGLNSLGGLGCAQPEISTQFRRKTKVQMALLEPASLDREDLVYVKWTCDKPSIAMASNDSWHRGCRNLVWRSFMDGVSPNRRRHQWQKATTQSRLAQSGRLVLLMHGCSDVMLK